MLINLLSQNYLLLLFAIFIIEDGDRATDHTLGKTLPCAHISENTKDK